MTRINIEKIASKMQMMRGQASPGVDALLADPRYLEPVPIEEMAEDSEAVPMPARDQSGLDSGFLPKRRGYDGLLATRRRVVGGGVTGPTKCNSPRSNSSHWTVSPPSRPMAAARAKGKLT